MTILPKKKPGGNGGGGKQESEPGSDSLHGSGYSLPLGANSGSDPHHDRLYVAGVVGGAGWPDSRVGSNPSPPRGWLTAPGSPSVVGQERGPGGGSGAEKRHSPSSFHHHHHHHHHHAVDYDDNSLDGAPPSSKRVRCSERSGKSGGSSRGSVVGGPVDSVGGPAGVPVVSGSHGIVGGGSVVVGGNAVSVAGGAGPSGSSGSSAGGAPGPAGLLGAYGGPAVVMHSANSPSCSSRVVESAGLRGRARARPGVEDDEDVDDDDDDEVEVGYNSEDEYSHLGVTLSEEEWAEKDRRFERVMRRKGYVIKKMAEDGACLFRAVADQLFGDQEMHRYVRNQCMNYVERNRDYFSQYITENFEEYVSRKRFCHVHGNHLEIQALSELYNRPIHIYCYSSEPINIFQAVSRNNEVVVPIRLCYHREVHYNSLIDPNNAAIGLGLGLPGIKPGADKKVVRDAVAQNDNILTEQQMLHDKIVATDWEATNEAIEEQVARESYLQWVQEQEKLKSKSNRPTPAATITSGQMSPRCSSTPPTSSPRPLPTSRPSPVSSPRAGTSSQPDPGRDSPVPGSSRGGEGITPAPARPAAAKTNTSSGPPYQIRREETATFLNGLPSELFGLDDWGDDPVLRQVLAESQQEYLDSLKKQREEADDA